MEPMMQYRRKVGRRRSAANRSMRQLGDPVITVESCEHFRADPQDSRRGYKVVVIEQLGIPRAFEMWRSASAMRLEVIVCIDD
jgi:hypothetical protein